MKVAVFSDSHGNVDYLKNVISWLREKGVDLIIHLGDDFDDADIFKDTGIKLIRVPGVFSHYYQDPAIPNRLVETLEGWRVLITHTSSSHSHDRPEDLKPEDLLAKQEIDIMLYGHTHIPKVEKVEGILWINPGHGKTDDKKGYPPSFALLELKGNRAYVKTINMLTYELMGSYDFLKG